MSDSELTFKTKSKEKTSDKHINWEECICHSTGLAGGLSIFF